MRRCTRFFPLAIFLFLALPLHLYPQSAKLKEIHAEGMKTLTEAQVAQLSGLAPGAEVDRKNLQDAADLLLRTGLFTRVTYKFDTHNDSVTLSFHVEEGTRLPVTYDNFPWFSDGELTEAIRNDLPFYDGTLPQDGAVVDLAGNSLAAFLSSRGLNADVRHLVLANPLLDGSVQEFHLEGVTQTIASIDFSDPALKGNRAFQQHLPEIRGKPYSRLAIDVFLAESIRPLYAQQGYLRAKIGPAEVRLSGNPNQKFPQEIAVYVPCDTGAVYHWKEGSWDGNSAVSTETLKRAIGLNPGDVANGVTIEGAWDRVREAYARLGYLEAKVTPSAAHDDRAHTVTYSVKINEGRQFHFREMVITGMSLAGERLIRDAWPLKPGDVMDKTVFENFLTTLESHRDMIFKGLPVHYDTVGHWLQTDPNQGAVDALLDFK